MIFRNPHFLYLGIVTALVSCGDDGAATSSVEDYAMLNLPPETLSAETPAEAIVILEMIEVDGASFSEWTLANSLSPSHATGLRREVQRWVQDGAGRVVETAAVHNRSGQRATTRSVREVIYPTEYEYPVIERTAEDKDEEDETLPEVTQEVIAGVAPAPRVFDMREVGTILDVETVIDSASGVIDVTLAPQLVQYFENIEWHAQVGDDEEQFGVPIFERNAISTSISLQDSVYGFLGSGRLPDESRSPELEDSIFLVFVRVDTNFAKPL